MKREKEVIHVSTRERILTIRLLEKAADYPAFAQAIGIECVQETSASNDDEEPP